MNNVNSRIKRLMKDEELNELITNVMIFMNKANENKREKMF
jgi:hypothetical protein